MLPIKAPLGPQIVSVSEESNLTAADQLMKSSKGLSLVVLNENKEICGLLSGRNISEALLAKNGEKKIKALLSSAFLVVFKDTLLKDLCQRMMNESFAGFFISHQGHIEAVICSEELLKIIHHLVVKIPESSSLDDPFFKATVGQYLENRQAFGA